MLKKLLIAVSIVCIISGCSTKISNSVSPVSNPSCIEKCNKDKKEKEQKCISMVETCKLFKEHADSESENPRSKKIDQTQGNITKKQYIEIQCNKVHTKCKEKINEKFKSCSKLCSK